MQLSGAWAPQPPRDIFGSPGRDGLGRPPQLICSPLGGITDSSQLVPLSRHNHYVSRGYLKRWEALPGRVWTYRVLVSHPAVPLWKQVSTRGVAYREHLYTRIAASGESDQLERWLNTEFETPAEESIEKAISGQRLRPEDWRRLIRFFAAQDVRTPARLVENLQRWPESLPGIIKDTLDESVRKLEGMSDEERAALSKRNTGHDPIPFRVTVEKHSGTEGGILRGETIAGRGLWVWGIRHLLSNTLRVLYTHRWTILTPPPDVTWITSDDPVLKLNFNSLSDYSFGGGWGHPGTDLMLPLGPRHMLYTQVGRAAPKRDSPMSADKTEVIRRLIAEHAHRLVFATTPDASLAALRPRIIDSALLERESSERRSWHRDQTAAERELMGWDTPKTDPS